MQDSKQALTFSQNMPAVIKNQTALDEYNGEGGNPYLRPYVVKCYNLPDIYLTYEQGYKANHQWASGAPVLLFAEGAISRRGSSITGIYLLWSVDNPPPKPEIEYYQIWDYEKNCPIYKADPASEQKLKYWLEAFGGEE